MTQKSALFKGQQKKQEAVNRHGRMLKIRKGKFQKAPTKKTDDFFSSKEATKFINSANEVKAATMAVKEGAQLRLVKAPVVTSTKRQPKKRKPT